MELPEIKNNKLELNIQNDRHRGECWQKLGLSFFSILIIFLMTMLSIFVERRGAYNKQFQKFFLIELAATFAIVIIICLRKSNRKRTNIDRFAMIFWGGFTLYTFIADILVDKKFRFSETLIFITLFLLGYAWNKSGEKESFIRDLEIAVQLFLVALIACSILFPVQSRVTGRYSGPIENPSVYALYLCSIWAVLLGTFESELKNKACKARLILTLVEMLVTLALVMMSQSLTPMIALTAVTFIWLFRFVRTYKGTRFALKVFIAFGIAGVAALIGFTLLVRNMDIISESRIIQKLQSADISSFLSDRDYYWRRYLRDMNLFGHSKKPYLWYHRILPHNALIGMMYWYGVPCVIPYILMMMMAVEKSWRYADTGLKYAAVPFYSIVSFIIMSMADNVEQPFVWLPWITCYLMMAPILVMPVEEIEAMKENKNGVEVEAGKTVETSGKHDIKVRG